MKRAYLALQRLYPSEYRALFGDEMLSAFERTAEERRKSGRSELVYFAAAELLGLLGGAALEWRAKFAQSARYLTPVQEASLEEQIHRTIKRMEHAIATHKFTEARFYAEAERRLRAKLPRG